MAENGEAEKTKRPANTAFKQQRLKAWQPILTASTALPVFFGIGIVFVPLGAVLLVASDSVQEKRIEYTDCKTPGGEKCADLVSNHSGLSCNCRVNFTLDSAFEGQVYMYYGLSNFYQNHRRYVRSRDDLQLNGNLKQKVNKDCAPFDRNGSDVAIAPCGAIANSLFNDTFRVLQTKKGGNVALDLTYKDIAWKTDRTVKFKNPSGNLEKAFEKFAKPPNWPKPASELSSDADNNGFVNQDFIVWMRTAAFSTFRKLHRRVVMTGDFKDGLPQGDYQLDITYNFPVKLFGGEKRVILSTTSWIGGKNPFLGIAYITVGILCLVLGACFLIVHLKFSKRGFSSADGMQLQDMMN